MKKRGLTLVLAGITALSITGLNVSTAQVNKDNFKRHVNKEAGYTIDAPEDWTASTQEHQPPGGGEAKSYFVLTGTAKDRVNVSHITVIVSPAASESAEDYVKNLLYSYTKSFKKFELESKEALDINGKSFASFIINHELQGVDYRMLTVFTMGNDLVYQINAIAPVEHFKNDKETIDAIVGTFRITK